MLRRESLRALIERGCAHDGQAMAIEVAEIGKAIWTVATCGACRCQWTATGKLRKWGGGCQERKPKGRASAGASNGS